MRFSVAATNLGVAMLLFEAKHPAMAAFLIVLAIGDAVGFIGDMLSDWERTGRGPP